MLPLNKTEEGEEIDRLRAENADLKARLNAIKKYARLVGVSRDIGIGERLHRMSDLRNKNWRGK